jgi:hypothetical protein
VSGSHTYVAKALPANHRLSDGERPQVAPRDWRPGMPVAAYGRAGSVGLFVRMSVGSAGNQRPVNGFVSASHVLDWCGGGSNEKSTGNPVFCPGPPYGNRRARDQIGMISDYIRLVPKARPPTPNDADIALVELEEQTAPIGNNVPNPRDVRDLSSSIIGVIAESNLKDAKGAKVFKCGAGSGFTSGFIADVGLDKYVLMPDDKEYLMTRCVIVRAGPGEGIFSQPGDSGALVYDGAGTAVGFIVGGSPDETIVHPAEPCLQLMGVEVWKPPG